MVVLADLPGGHRMTSQQLHVKPLTCSRGQVLHHAGQVIAVGVAVAQEQDVLVAPGQPVSALVREGQPRRLDMTGGAVPSGGVAAVTGTRGLAVTPAVAVGA